MLLSWMLLSAFILYFVIFFSKRKKRALRRQSLWSSPQRKHRATTTMQNAKEDMHMWLSIHGPMHNAYAIVWCPVPGGIFGLVTTYMVMVFDSLFHGVWVLFFYSCWELWEAFLLVGLVLFVMDLLLQKLKSRFSLVKVWSDVRMTLTMWHTCLSHMTFRGCTYVGASTGI